MSADDPPQSASSHDATWTDDLSVRVSLNEGRRNQSPAARRKADVFIVHPSRLLVDGLTEVLSRLDDVRVAGTCARLADLPRGNPNRLRDCVVLVDGRLSKSDPDLLPAIVGAGSGVKVVLLMSEPDDQQVLRALQLGVRGVVLESMGVRLLVSCIRKVHAGEEWIEQLSAGRLLRRLAIREAAEGAATLTRREMETLRGVARGLSNAEIGAELSINPVTVKTHVHNIFRKLDVTSRVAVANWARARGIL